MRLIKKGLIGAVAAAAASVCIAALAGPAAALPADYTVSPAGDTSITLDSGSNTLTFQDTSAAAAQLVCTPGSTAAFTGTGVAHGGDHTFAPPLNAADTAADVTGAALNNCTNTIVGSVAVTLSGFNWGLSCTALTATGCDGVLFGVTAHLDAPGCSLDASGTINGSYDNLGTFTGTTDPGLTVENVSGALCPLIPVNNGDVAFLSGVINVSPAITVS